MLVVVGRGGGGGGGNLREFWFTPLLLLRSVVLANEIKFKKWDVSSVTSNSGAVPSHNLALDMFHMICT